MKRDSAITVAIIGLVGGVLTTILGASWFTPKLLRLDVFFPTHEVSILDDFVFVHFDGYEEPGSGPPLEDYLNPYTQSKDAIFDKATYVEYVWLRKTSANYTIDLTTSGTPPEIKAISPPLKTPTYQLTPSGAHTMVADLALEESAESTFSGITPNPKMVYVYRNGFQGRNSWGGKNVKYSTDRLTFVYDFSLLRDWLNLFQAIPQACRKNLQEDEPIPLDVKWGNGIAIIEAFNLKKGDKVRIFWTWNRFQPGAEKYSPVKCNDTLG